MTTETNRAEWPAAAIHGPGRILAMNQGWIAR